jgi:3-oxoacyl-[acyl-carrier protein] reductase
MKKGLDRRVLVTGASRGIGRAIALRLAADGFQVTINYKSREAAASQVLQEIEASGGSAELLPFDVSDREQARRVLSGAMEKSGAFYGVVSNAGIYQDAPFPGLKDDDWDRVLTTNLGGFYNVVQPIVMPMIRLRSGGRIAVMSSVSGIIGNRGQVSYSASKAGLIGAARSLSLELAKRNITVNSVAPGLTETDMVRDMPVNEIAKLIPMRRLGRAEEVAAVVGFLLSDEASYVTGQCISVNGGMA